MAPAGELRTNDRSELSRREVANAYGWLLAAVVLGGALVDFWNSRIAILLAALALFAALVGIGVAIRRDHENDSVEALGHRKRIRRFLAGIAAVLLLITFGLPQLTNAALQVPGLSFLTAITCFVLLSSAINEFRFSKNFGPTRGPLLLGATVALVVISLWGFAAIDSRLGLAMGALSIGLGHIGIVAASEDWIDAQVDNDAERLRSGRKWIAILVLPGILGLFLGFALLRSGGLTWPYALLVLSVLGIAVASAASKGDGDLLAIVVAIIFIWAAAPSEASQPDSPTGSTYLVLGDSFISGEGAEEFFTGTNMKGPNTADQNTCRRAPTAWAMRLATAESRPDSTPSSVLFLPCSGATTRHLPAQLVQLEAAHRESSSIDIDLVFVSLGGNDAGFSTLGQTCIGPGNCATIVDTFRAPLAATVEQNLIAAYESIRDAVGDVPIVAVPYPEPINPKGCGGTLLDQSEHFFVAAFVDELNSVVRSAAARAGVLYLDSIETALTTTKLRLCDGNTVADRGINFIEASPMTGSIDVTFNPLNWLNNSIHPNEIGHEAMLDAALTWLSSTQLENPPPSAQSPYAVASITELIDATTVACSDRSDRCADANDATKWLLGQTVREGRTVWWVLGLIAAAAWATSIPLIATAHARKWTTNRVVQALRKRLGDHRK